MTVQMFTTCPGCGEIAEIRDYFVLPSTEGPVEHVQTFCVGRHWFQMPTANLDRVSALVPPAAADAPDDEGWDRVA